MRIGIIGTGRITGRFVSECAALPQVMITAVYNPNLASAQHFVREHFGTDINCADLNGAASGGAVGDGGESDKAGVIATDDLDDFAAAIDAAYIASPHEMHVIYAKTMLLSGKHVLAEKPMAFTARDAAELYELAGEKRLILMEAVKTACCPGFLGLIDLLNKGIIGPVRDVEACFTKIGSAAGREMLGEYAGSFYELGSYPLLPIVKIMGTDSIESYIWSLDSVAGADAYAKCVISYSSGVATAKTGLGVKSEGELIVAGETGYIRVPSPWWLTSKIEVHHEDPNKVEIYEYPYEGSGLRYEIDLFARKIEVLNEMNLKYGGEPNISGPVWEEIMNTEGVAPAESIWMAAQMENFGIYLSERRKQGLGLPLGIAKEDVRIWAHRGLSMIFPENTLPAFEAAAKETGIAGIELDVQLTSDGELVVIHDEKLERTTTLKGRVADHTLCEIKSGKITPSGHDEGCSSAGENSYLRVPTLREVFDLLKPYCIERGLLINIELKNGVVPYEGLEQKVIDLVHEYGLMDYIVYSSFNHASMGLIKRLEPSAKTGALAVNITDAIKGMKEYNLDAVHPGRIGMDINISTMRELIEKKIPVRMWNSDEPFYGQTRPLHSMDYREYAAFGATDIFTNLSY